MKVYKLGKGWAVLLFICAPLCIGLGIWMLLLPLIPSMDVKADEGFYLVLAPISVGMIVLFVLALMDARKGTFVIDSDRLYTTNVFNSRVLLFDEISGFREVDKYIFVESHVKGKKRLKISSYYGKYSDIRQWLYEHYDDLDIVNKLAEENQILSDEKFGRTVEERESKLKQARLATKVLTVIAGGVSAWCYIWPYPYEYVMIALIVLPILAVLLLKVSGGMVHLETRKDSAYPSIVLVVFLSSFLLILRVFLDFNILEYDNTWLPSLLGMLIVISVILIGNQELSFKKAKDFLIVMGYAVLLLCSSYGTIIFLNCHFDHSALEVLEVEILDKRVSTGKHTSYYIELSPWGTQTEAEEVSISSDLYDRMEIGDTARVYLRKGEFDIPWFEIGE